MRPRPAGSWRRSIRPTCGSGRSSTRCGRLSKRVLAAVGVVPALQRRRRRAEQDRDVLQAGTHDGHVAGMVARRRFLLERAFVLLVDDDEAELARRSEHGAAGADHDLNLAGRHPPPVAAALGVAEVAVQHGHLITAAAEAWIVCGVRLISGTRTSASLPWLTTSSMARR